MAKATFNGLLRAQRRANKKVTSAYSKREIPFLRDSFKWLNVANGETNTQELLHKLQMAFKPRFSNYLSLLHL